jgi:tetratricopeptide (TPR) repeat protein
VLLVAPRAAASSICTDLVEIGRVHEAEAREARALRAYTDALTLDASCSDAYLALGSLRARMGQHREADRVYSVALARVPGLAVALLERARVRRALGARMEAADDLAAYARVEGDASALRELGRWNVEDGQLPAALSTFRALLAVARERGDEALAAEAKTTVRALQILVGHVDPVLAPPTNDRTRAAFRHIARRGG